MAGVFTSICVISIHVPREGDDCVTIANRNSLIISIHVPREGDDGQVGI